MFNYSFIHVIHPFIYFAINLIYVHVQQEYTRNL